MKEPVCAKSPAYQPYFYEEPATLSLEDLQAPAQEETIEDQKMDSEKEISQSNFENFEEEEAQVEAERMQLDLTKQFDQKLQFCLTEPVEEEAIEEEALHEEVLEEKVFEEEVEETQVPVVLPEIAPVVSPAKQKEQVEEESKKTSRTFETVIDIEATVQEMRRVMMRGFNSEPVVFKQLLKDAAQFVLKDKVWLSAEQWKLEEVDGRLEKVAAYFGKMSGKRLKTQVADLHTLCFNMKLELLK